MDKSKLLTSTALISAAVFMTAGNANALSLKLGGFYEAWVGYAGNDKKHLGNATLFKADAPNNFDVKTDGELHFRAEETLPNGMKVGALLEMEAGVGHDGGSGPPNQGRATNGTTALDTVFDEAFAWVKTRWGQVNIGNNDVAAAYVGGLSTEGPVGITKSDISDWLPGEWALNNSDNDLGAGDAGNITYFSPKVAGTQVIISYTPDMSDWGLHEKDISETVGVVKVWSGAVKYGGKFGMVGIGLAAGYTQANEGTGTAGDTHYYTGYNGKGSVTVGPVKLDAVFAHENLGAPGGAGNPLLTARHDEYWGVSGTFTINSANRVSLAYADSQRRGGDKNDSEILTAGFEHDLGAGATLAASAFWGKADGATNTTDDNDGFGIVGGLALKF